LLSIRNECLFVIKNIGVQKHKNTLKNQSARIMFLGLDLFDRCLLKLDKSFKKNNEKNKAIRKCIDLAYICTYIATKYFLDESTPKLTKIFPNITITPKKIEKIERIILRDYLKYKIYRITIYDMLTININPLKLFNLMNESMIYNHRIDEIVDILTSINIT
jgi:hypothetical protein